MRCLFLSVMLMTCGLAGVPPRATAADAATVAAESKIFWGEELNGFKLGLQAPGPDFKSGQPTLLTLYIQLPEAVTTPPAMLRQQRAFRAIGGGGVVHEYVLANWEATADPQVYKTPYLVVTVPRNGTVSMLAVQPVEPGTGVLPLGTGLLDLQVNAAPSPIPTPIVADIRTRVQQEKLHSIEIPEIRNRGLPLTRFVPQLDSLAVMYDDSSQGLNLIWLPPPAANETVNLEFQLASLHSILTEIGTQTNRKVYVDTAAVIMSRSDLDLKALIANPDAEDLAANLEHMNNIAFKRLAWSRQSPQAIADALGPVSRQLDPQRTGLSVELKLPDEQLESTRVTLELRQVNMAEAVRYLALTLGCRYEVHADRVVFVP